MQPNNSLLVKHASLSHYPRDFFGYGPNTPDPKWPGNAKIAVSFVLNYEEGGENTVVNGDPTSETFLNETPGGTAVSGNRDINMETQYEYGARCGVWRILRMFRERRMNLTVYAVGRAMELNPAVGKVFVEDGHEVASHGYKWIQYQNVPEEVEREHVRKAIEAIQRSTGSAPVGWYTGRVSPQTRRIVIEEYEKLGLPLLYDSDAYNDDLPYWIQTGDRDHLVIPYTLDVNDMKFSVAPGFSSPEGYFEYLKNTFDTIYEEGLAGSPKMISVGLHCRLVGRPGRAKVLGRFLDYINSKEGVWVARRSDIALHWRKVFPPPSISVSAPPNQVCHDVGIPTVCADEGICDPLTLGRSTTPLGDEGVALSSLISEKSSEKSSEEIRVRVSGADGEVRV